MTMIAQGVDMPVIGLGTWQLRGERCRSAVKAALAAGYRHIDTALIYDNQPDIAKGIAGSGVSREDVFITSKIWRDRLDVRGVREQTDTILSELNTDYVDLLLVHWPNNQFPLPETLDAMTRLQEAGRVRALGVSNFTQERLKEVLAVAGNVAVNQVEYHPSFQQEGLREFCARHDITLTAYSPLGQGRDVELPEILRIGDKHQKPPEQVILNWLRQKSITAIPRTADPAHIRSNIAALEWSLDADDIAALNVIEQRDRLLSPPFAEFT